MFDLGSCATEAARGWAMFSWQLFYSLLEPGVVLPPLVGLIVLPWLLKSFPWKQIVSGFGGGLMMIYLLGATPGVPEVISRPLVSFVPDNPSETVDAAIVILGRGPELRDQRVAVAAELWRSGRSSHIFASGRGDALPILQSLQILGIPKEDLDGEECSNTTEQNAQFTQAKLGLKGVRRIVLVTDPPHMLRSWLTFRSYGFAVVPYFSPIPTNLETRQKTLLVLREYVGLVTYGLKGRFLPRNLAN